MGDHDLLFRHAFAKVEDARGVLALFKYIARVNPKAQPEVLKGLLPEGRGAEVEEAVMNLFLEGLAEAQRVGELKGQRGMLLKLLRGRFGALPEAAVARLEVAESPQVDLWGTSATRGAA